MELKLGFMATGRGSNVKTILENIEKEDLYAEAKVVISNNPNAGVLKIAKEKHIPYYYLNIDDVILKTLQDNHVNLVILAGYLKKISEVIINGYPNRILNIHPAINLEKYGGEGMYGMYVHEAVISSDDKESGATVHLVTLEYDKGRILSQYRVPRYSDDTVKTLAERVLEAEHKLYTQVLRAIQSGVINID